MNSPTSAPSSAPVSKGKALAATERIESNAPMPGRGPMGGGMVGQKAMTFGPSAKRLIARMRPERSKTVLVVLLGVASVGLMRRSERLGHALSKASRVPRNPNIFQSSRGSTTKALTSAAIFEVSASRV